MKLSVMVVTCDHAAFIADALASALTQETDFAYEIVVGDDCSIDGTRQIVQTFQATYPGRIRLLAGEEHLGLTVNFLRTYRSCHGEYVAVLGGEDYWTSPLKLQRQVEFLERHVDCVLCFHRARVLDEQSGREHEIGPSERRECYDLEDLLVENFIPPSSVAVRNGVTGPLPNWLGELLVTDWPTYILHAEHGKLGYLNETLTTCRHHAGSVWWNTSYEERVKTVRAMYGYLNEHFQFSDDALFQCLIRQTDACVKWHDERRRLWNRVVELTAEQAVQQERIKELEGSRSEHVRLRERIEELRVLEQERLGLYKRIDALSVLAEEHAALSRRIPALADERTALEQQVRELTTRLPEAVGTAQRRRFGI